MLSMIYDQPIWAYFSATQKDLIREGNYLMEVTEKQGYQFKDYSFLVFPYAKAYEGYLKQLFLDIGFMNHLDYVSDHYRIGKYLSPHMINRLEDKSIYVKIRNMVSNKLASDLWEAWKEGRNQVFHYYPHNIKRLTFEEAKAMNEQILNVMIESFEQLHVKPKAFERE